MTTTFQQHLNETTKDNVLDKIQHIIKTFPKELAKKNKDSLLSMQTIIIAMLKVDENDKDVKEICDELIKNVNYYDGNEFLTVLNSYTEQLRRNNNDFIRYTNSLMEIVNIIKMTNNF